MKDDANANQSRRGYLRGGGKASGSVTRRNPRRAINADSRDESSGLRRSARAKSKPDRFASLSTTASSNQDPKSRVQSKNNSSGKPLAATPSRNNRSRSVRSDRSGSRNRIASPSRTSSSRKTNGAAHSAKRRRVSPTSLEPASAGKSTIRRPSSGSRLQQSPARAQGRAAARPLKSKAKTNLQGEPRRKSSERRNRPVTFELEADDGSLTSRIPLFEPSEYIGQCVFGKQWAETTCSGCGNVSRREEPFVCLSVDMDLGKNFSNPNGDYARREAALAREESHLLARQKQQAEAERMAANLSPSQDASAIKSISLSDAGSPPRPSDRTPRLRPRSPRLGPPASPSVLFPRRARSGRSSSSSITLESCLRLTSATSKLDGENQYACDICRCNRDAERRVLLGRLPQVLIIHLNRAFWTGRGKVKSQAHVDFPLNGLDLGPFCSSQVQAKPSPLHHLGHPRAGSIPVSPINASEAGEETMEDEDIPGTVADGAIKHRRLGSLERLGHSPVQTIGPAALPKDSEGSPVVPLYDLASIVVHHGRGIDKGHYTSLCYDR